MDAQRLCQQYLLLPTWELGFRRVRCAAAELILPCMDEVTCSKLKVCGPTRGCQRVNVCTTYLGHTVHSYMSLRRDDSLHDLARAVRVSTESCGPSLTKSLTAIAFDALRHSYALGDYRARQMRVICHCLSKQGTYSHSPAAKSWHAYVVCVCGPGLAVSGSGLPPASASCSV